jgi:molecular chaperone GrpE
MEENINNVCGDNCACKTEKKVESNSTSKKKCSCKETISNLKLKLSELDDKYLRSVADFENYKKRVQKEKEEIKDNTKISLIYSILDMDNDLNLAIKNIKDDESKKGVELIISKMEKFLKSHNIESIQTDNYDPDLHEVISVLTPGSNKIIDVINKGYTLNEKPFKYPKVILG